MINVNEEINSAISERIQELVDTIHSANYFVNFEDNTLHVTNLKDEEVEIELKFTINKTPTDNGMINVNINIGFEFSSKDGNVDFLQDVITLFANVKDFSIRQ